MLAMTTPNFLWLDYRRRPSAPSLFQALHPHWVVQKWVRPLDMLVPIRAFLPQFLCFEFDTPHTTELAMLENTHLRHPGLPILMLTEDAQHGASDTALQRGVWDCLDRSVSADDLNATIGAFTQFCERRHQKGIASAPSQTSETRLRTQAARDFLTTHFADEVRLPVAAELCHLSTSEFSRCFKKENGCTFSDFLLQLRIRKACELLSDRRLQVKSVAFDVGFNDVSYFARAFRRHTGMTPSGFQQAGNPAPQSATRAHPASV